MKHKSMLSDKIIISVCKSSLPFIIISKQMFEFVKKQIVIESECGKCQNDTWFIRMK
jgi:hypothetical protein